MCCGRVVELLPEKFVGEPVGGQKVQAVRGVRTSEVAQDAVPWPGLPRKVWEGLILVGDILEGLDEELVEIILVGDLSWMLRISHFKVLSTYPHPFSHSVRYRK